VVVVLLPEVMAVSPTTCKLPKVVLPAARAMLGWKENAPTRAPTRARHVTTRYGRRRDEVCLLMKRNPPDKNYGSFNNEQSKKEGHV
jgi:hypothetical protein